MNSILPPASELHRLPTGTVTFLFTDIADSTPLWEKFPEAMKPALAAHDSILKAAIEAHRGLIVKTTGDGVHAVFIAALDAITAALEAQRDLQASTFLRNSGVEIHVRMGIHIGEAELREEDYYGQSLNRAARIMSAGHGGQILISDVTARVARENLPEGTSLLDMGEHYLKGLLLPEHIYQLWAPGLPREFPALLSLPKSRNNLPPEFTSFIGRERELAAAQEKLASARLLTLIGPGGTGKTRLSLQVAAEQLPNFRDGVWLIELAPISDPAFIVSAMASVFELREVPGTSLFGILLDYLRSKQLLLLLDNCEHLVEATAQIANKLLQECTNLTIIASSREALGIDGETVYRVPSLLEDEATRLFIDRATKAEPRFHLTDENASFVNQICSRLDGIPLAIELAAARVKLLTPEQIALRLDDRFKLLAGGSRTALPRQQTLRALIDWSYQLLNETEQRALRGLSVFSGGWTIEAAESVLGESDALDGLLGLVNKSLVIVEEQGGKSRYRFLETIRQYAMEKLAESGEAVAARDRHVDYVLTLANYSPENMFGLEEPEQLDRIETEHDNLRAALEWAAENHLSKAVKLARAVSGFWALRDYNSEARAWCRTILEKTSSLPDLDRDRARLFAAFAWSAVTTGEHKAGRDASEQAILLGKKAEDPATVVRAYATLALTSTFLGDFQTAFNAVAEAEKLGRHHNLSGELAFALSTRAQMEFSGTKDFVKARAYLREASDLAKKAGLRWASSFMAIGLGHTAAMLGDMKAARTAFAESAEVARKMGNKRIVYSSQSELAHTLRQHGELDEPLAIYRELLPKWKDLGHRAAVAHELECIGYILIRKEEPQRAVVLLGAAEAIRRAIDIPRTNNEQLEYEGELSTLREMLGSQAFTQHWATGEKLTIDEAIELASK